MDSKEIKKLEKEAKSAKREGWGLAYVMDENPEKEPKEKQLKLASLSFRLKLKDLLFWMLLVIKITFQI